MIDVAARNEIARRVHLLHELRSIGNTYRYTRDRRRKLAREAREAGATWMQIGRALGVGHQSAIQLVRREAPGGEQT